MNKVASNEAYQYVKDSRGFHWLYDDTIGVFIRTDKPKQNLDPDFGLPDYKKVVNGFSSVPETMVKKFLQASDRFVFVVEYNYKPY